jgi:hypothetical protein
MLVVSDKSQAQNLLYCQRPGLFTMASGDGGTEAARIMVSAEYALLQQ